MAAPPTGAASESTFYGGGLGDLERTAYGSASSLSWLVAEGVRKLTEKARDRCCGSPLRAIISKMPTDK